MKITSLVLITLFPFLSEARPPADQLKPLSFQADKNNIQVLPQRFEYALLEDGNFQIGDIQIDQRKLTFQITEASNGQAQLTFQWPAALFREGQIIVKNNIGKAILSKKIDKDFSANSRSESAEYNLLIDKDQVEDLKYAPFMSFCIFREDSATRISLCSRELYLSYQNGPMTIKSRAENKKTAQVEINGQVVGNQGYIFLNSAREKFTLKASTAAGSSLEIETRRKDIDLKDVISIDDGKYLLLTAAGADPVDESQISRVSKNEWQAKLDTSRPYIYLKGDGDIPMRQELLVKGSLPTEKDRVYTDKKSRTRTYASSLSLNVYTPKGIVARPMDKNSRVEAINAEQIRWNLGHLPAESKVRRYLHLKKDKQQFIVGQDIFRGTPYEVGLNALYFNPSSIAYLNAHFLGWLSAGDLHWGFRLSHLMHLTTKSDEAKLDITSGEVLYRFQSGFYLEDETWGASLSYQSVKADTQSVSMPGVGLFTHQKTAVRGLDWYQLQLKYFLGSSGSGFKIKSAYAADWTASTPLKDSLLLNYGLSLQQFKFDPAAAKEDLQIGLKLGIAYLF